MQALFRVKSQDHAAVGQSLSPAPSCCYLMRLLIRRQRRWSAIPPHPRTPGRSLAPCCVVYRLTPCMCNMLVSSCTPADEDTWRTVAYVCRRCSLMGWQKFHYDKRTLGCFVVCRCDDLDVTTCVQLSRSCPGVAGTDAWRATCRDATVDSLCPHHRCVVCANVYCPSRSQSFARIRTNRLVEHVNPAFSAVIVGLRNNFRFAFLIVNFFSGRTIRTKIDSSFSDIADLISGVVQGSGIGPLMFLAYINGLFGILEQHNIKVKLFADDLKNT